MDARSRSRTNKIALSLSFSLREKLGKEARFFRPSLSAAALLGSPISYLEKGLTTNDYLPIFETTNYQEKFIR